MKVRLTEDQQEKKEWLLTQMGDNFKPIDLPIIENLAFALDRLEFMDSQLNDIPSLLSDKVYMASREKILKQVNECYKMLDITPQARAKKQAEVVKEAETDPLLSLLGE